MRRSVLTKAELRSEQRAEAAEAEVERLKFKLSRLGEMGMAKAKKFKYSVTTTLNSSEDLQVSAIRSTASDMLRRLAEDFSSHRANARVEDWTASLNKVVVKRIK